MCFSIGSLLHLTGDRMETDNQLRELYKLTESQLGYEAYTEITGYTERTNFTFDTSKLFPESRRRISFLYSKHFGE